MTEATLCFLLRGNPPHEILLGFKKARFGAGKYNGFGGKVEADESVEHAAVRELTEETGIVISESALVRAAEITFYFPAKPEWDQRVHVFLVREWTGQAVEGEEMRPEWFTIDQIPFHQMWQDDSHWLPQVLTGQPVRASFVFGPDNETVVEMSIRELSDA